MTEIVNGELRYIEETKNAHGGTELMARRMVRDINPKLLDGVQIIHSRVRTLEPGMKRILVCHDLPNDPEVAKLTDPEYRKNFDKIVFVSHHQQHMYNLVLGVPFAESEVIPNGIEIEHPIKDFEGDKIRLIYHTTPHRGLQLLVPAFKELSKHFNVELDVYSSFKAYGWEERDQQYQELFDELKSMDQVHYHGFQPNEVVREALIESDVFAYPSIWSETSCIALIEAMCSGVFSIHSNLGALPETSRGLTRVYMYNENLNAHLQSFYVNLYGEVEGISRVSADQVTNIKRNLAGVAGSHYNWNRIVPKWERLLGEIN